MGQRTNFYFKSRDVAEPDLTVSITFSGAIASIFRWRFCDFSPVGISSPRKRTSSSSSREASTLTVLT